MSDELAKRISERQAQKSAVAAAAEVERKKAEGIAQTVPSLWMQALGDLLAAIADATRLFSERGEPRRHFQWQLRPQPSLVNHARIAMAHRDTGVYGDISLTFVTAGLNGIVVATHPSFERTYELSQLGRNDWDSRFTGTTSRRALAETEKP